MAGKIAPYGVAESGAERAGNTRRRSPVSTPGARSTARSPTLPRAAARQRPHPGRVSSIEPFFGSGAVLLHRPFFEAEKHLETVNDLDGLLCIFWRRIKAGLVGVARHADNPVIETDLYARHVCLTCNRAWLTREMETDPEWFDVKAAGWWVWGISCWMGGAWCGNGNPPRSRPHLSGHGHGINRLLERELCEAGIAASAEPLADYFHLLAQRLRRVRVCCGDWTRVLTPSATTGNGLTAILLDPPYADTAERCDQLYAMDSLSVAHAVREWAINHGNDPMLRIALCGYEGEHQMPDSWECYHWKAGIGFANRGQGNQNRRRERIWFSPHCLRTNRLFD